ncbi:L,D-transpeptidase [Saccharothrix sp. 6-C]|uniref:L,D-transpeptidase-like protein n=1 Tax=Saccharothrix texasensis TaxID=103734 RepID=A0A3N1H7H5_9PSEU|nr:MULTISPECIES: L,D-transpeptidase [Saccharothrix]QQQ77167.1 L,D-transpeptidase [Saccharothrix sp. 6-C]ROP38475.1 L,D-transpeptidase-like protein [Saccharothrix texasensis]
MRKTLGTTAIAAAALTFGLATPASAATGTPCSVQNGACVRLSTNQAWLIYDGNASYGPVPVSHGMPGHETPPGTYPVLRKVKDDWSVPYNGPMPNAVYFTTNGIAFHQGDTNTQSHGCVRLGPQESLVFYDNLFPGEQVQVVP